jgi:hypothetical protein
MVMESLDLLAERIGLFQHGDLKYMAEFFDPDDADVQIFIRYGLISPERVALLLAEKRRLRSPRP